MGATSAPWGERLARPRTRETYATWVEQLTPQATSADDLVTTGMPLDERLIVGLRRREGVAIEAPAELEQRWQPFVEQRLLLREGPRWRLSDPEGLALSNGVLRELLAWWDEQGSGAADPPPSL
jgi:oxygen-independent coproporphyrinogen-3 oxidase